MQIKYIALDGKQFDTEKDCYEYERSLHNLSDLVPELIMQCEYAPIKDYLDSLANTEDTGIRYENFIVRNKQDILDIANALNKLGYVQLSIAIISKNINVFPDILCLIYKHDKSFNHKYYKFSFIYNSYDIIKKYIEKIDRSICEKLNIELFCRQSSQTCDIHPIDSLRRLHLDTIQQFNYNLNKNNP